MDEAAFAQQLDDARKALSAWRAAAAAASGGRAVAEQELNRARAAWAAAGSPAIPETEHATARRESDRANDAVASLRHIMTRLLVQKAFLLVAHGARKTADALQFPWYLSIPVSGVAVGSLVAIGGAMGSLPVAALLPLACLATVIGAVLAFCLFRLPVGGACNRPAGGTAEDTADALRRLDAREAVIDMELASARALAARAAVFFREIDQKYGVQQRYSDAADRAAKAVQAEINAVATVERLKTQYDCLAASVSRRQRLLLAPWQSMAGTQFETFLQAVFQECGYAVQHIGGSGDFGADLILTGRGLRVLIQAKGYPSGYSVGGPDVVKTIGSREIYTCDVCAVITNSRFTRDARTAARGRCVLVDAEGIPSLLQGILPWECPSTASTPACDPGATF